MMVDQNEFHSTRALFFMFVHQVNVTLFDSGVIIIESHPILLLEMAIKNDNLVIVITCILNGDDLIKRKKTDRPIL